MVSLLFRIHRPVGLHEKLLGVGALLRVERMAHAEGNQILATNFTASLGGQATKAVLLFADHLRPQSGQNQDRKSTRLNSSHGYISYAVFCLKKKKNTNQQQLS